MMGTVAKWMNELTQCLRSQIVQASPLIIFERGQQCLDGVRLSSGDDLICRALFRAARSGDSAALQEALVFGASPLVNKATKVRA